MSKFHHNLSMQALSKSNSKVLLKFDAISELVMNINYLLQKQTYAFRMEEQQTRNATADIYDSVHYVKEETVEPNILEQEVAETILENKEIEYPIKEYYKTYYMPQTEQEIKEGKKERYY